MARVLSWRRKILELGIGLPGRALAPSHPPDPVRSILLIQPSHIGDVLVNTPLFEALRHLFPNAEIVLGCGGWNHQTLRLNPHLSELVALDMPWNNIFVQPQGLKAAFRYIFASPQVSTLAARRFDLGIDLIGTQLDALLLFRLGIPFRMGVRGAGGGHSAMHRWVPYDDRQPMARTALRFAEILGMPTSQLPSIRPRIYLSPDERLAGERLWQAGNTATDAPSHPPKRIILGPAASFAHKCWPLEYYESLIHMLLRDRDTDIVLVGGNDAVESCARLAAASPRVRNFAVKVPLREVFALVESSDLVICNSNMLMHVAAAFARPCIVVLSAAYESASQHKLQWGYDITEVLGRDPHHPDIFSASEVHAIALRLLGQN